MIERFLIKELTQTLQSLEVVNSKEFWSLLSDTNLFDPDIYWVGKDWE